MTEPRPLAYPIALHLAGRPCCVIGARGEAAQRSLALLAAGARVTIVGESPDEAVRELAARGEVTLRERPFQSSDLDGCWLAVQTDPDPELAAAVAREAEVRRLFFCAVDQPYASYQHLAVARAGALSCAIGTEGKAPALAKRLRQELARVFQAANLGAFVERLAALRERTPAAERRRVLGEYVERVTLNGSLDLPEDS